MEPTQHTIVIAIITNEKNEILLAKRHEPALSHAHNKWEFVGGGIEFGETPEKALKREVKEEIGVTIKIVRLLPKVFSHVWNLKNGKKQQVVMISYECKITKGKPRPNLNHEVGDVKFVAIKDIKKLDTLPQVYEMAKMILS